MIEINFFIQHPYNHILSSWHSYSLLTVVVSYTSFLSYAHFTFGITYTDDTYYFGARVGLCPSFFGIFVTLAFHGFRRGPPPNRDPSTASLASWVKGRSRPTRACDDGGICFPYSNELRVGSWQGIYRACVSTGHNSSCLEEISRFHFDIWRLPSIFFFTAQFQLVAT